jgi:hypothetical protein
VITPVAVTIIAEDLLGTPLAGGIVRFTPTRIDVEGSGSGGAILVPQVRDVGLDGTGQAVPTILPNVNSQYLVEFFTSARNRVETKGPVYATIPGAPVVACYLHDCLTTGAPVLSDAQRALNGAQAALAAAQAVLTDAGFVAVKNDLPKLEALNAALTALEALYGDLTNLNAVADALTALNALHDDLVNLNALHDDLANVDAVAGAINAVNACANNLQAILNAPTYAAQAQAAQAGAAASDADATAQAANANTFALSAAAQAAQAYAWSLSSASAQQQDLSALAKQLHYSPNAILGTLFYDTGKDSNPAWVDQVANASYMQEALNGPWLYGASNGFPTELDARCSPASVGSECITGADPTFGSATGYTLVGGASISAGVATIPANASVQVNTGNQPTTAGTIYRITITIAAVTGTAPRVTWGGVTLTFPAAVGTHTLHLGATATSANPQAIITGSGGTSVAVDSFSIKPVTGNFAASSSYYNNAADGRHYRLWQNLFYFSEFPNGTADGTSVTNVTASAFAGSAVGISTGIAYGDNSVAREIRKGAFAATNGLTYRFSVYVVMTDGLAPAFGNVAPTNAANDFYLMIGGTQIDPTTYSVTNLGGGLYRVSAIGTQGASNVTAHGVGKATTNSARTFTTSGWMFEVVPTPSSPAAPSAYEKKADASLGNSQTTNGNSNKPPRIWAMVWESGYLCIYDPTKPGCPLWKSLLTTGVSTALGAFSFATLTTNGVWAKEGKLYIGNNQGGLICDFANDKMTPMRAIAGGCMLADRRIAARNAQPVAGLTNVGVSGIDYINLGNNLTTCITGTTYSDAPVDPNTLLMQPTVFMGAGTTCTLLKDDGTVVTTTAMGGSVTYATMTPWYLLTANGSGQGAFFTLGNLRTVATNWPVSTWSPNSSQFTGDAAANLLACSRSLVAKLTSGPSLQGPSLGLMRLNASNQLASLFAKITPFSNTGWMVGDIRGCWLSSTVPGATVAGTNIITDSAFDNPATSALYFNQDGNISHSVGSGVLNVSTNINAGSSYVAYVAATEPGVQYTINAVFSVVAGCTGGFFDVRDGASPGSGGQLNLTGNVNGGSAATGAASTTFTAVSTLTSIRMVMVKTQNDASCTWDNHTCTVTALADRSYKANNLTLTGSLTKSAANAATQIMLYGGWSAANYARQAYSANLDPATGALRGTIWGTVPQCSAGSGVPVAGGFGPSTATYINPALFASAAVPPNFTSQWTLGTGWSATSGTTLTSNGTQVANSDTSWNIGQPAIAVGNVRMWAINVSAISGTLTVFANNGTAFAITAPGTYYGLGTVGGTAILRAAAGTTVSLTLGVQELLPAMAFHRAGAAGASYGLGINALAQLVAFCNDGTTNRVATAQAPSSTSQAMLIKAAMEYATSGTVSLRINSAPVQSTTGAPLGTLSNAAAVLTVGADYGLTAGWPGGLALLRIGMTNATQEQSALCFEHEYMMFQPGAVCALPDAAVLQDFSFDPLQQKLKSVSSGYESSLIGLTFSAQAAVSAGTFSRCAHLGGMKMTARATTNPGVDIMVPAYSLREELVNRDRAAADRARLTQSFDFSGGFTAQTFNASTLMTNTAGWTYPSQANQRGVGLSGSGIPANTTIADVTGNITYLSAAATAGASGVPISVTGFRLPQGVEAVDVAAGPAGSMNPKMEGVNNDYTRTFDGFCETVLMTPGSNARVRINGRRWQQ